MPHEDGAELREGLGVFISSTYASKRWTTRPR